MYDMLFNGSDLCAPSHISTPSAYAPHRTQSQALLPRTLEYVVTHRSHPKEHFTKTYAPFPADHDASCAGPDPSVTPLPQHGVTTRQDGDSSHPDESFYICKNHMMSSMGDVEGYSVSAFWPRQEFVVHHGGGGGGAAVLEWDVNLNDDHHTVRSWWEILITPRSSLRVGAGPIDSPISETYPDERIVLSFRRNVRQIRVGVADAEEWIVDEMQFGEYDYAYWRALHPNDPATVDHRIRRTMRVTFDDNQLTWGIATADDTMDEWSVPLPGGVPFAQGLVLFKTHAYTPTKDGNFDTYTFHWDNIRFSGPVTGRYDTFAASSVVYLQRNGSRAIGDNDTVTVNLPVLETMANPVLFGQVHHPMRGQVLLSINGEPNIEVSPYAYENDGCWSVDWQSFRLPLDPNVLVAGENTLTWTVGPRPPSSCVPDEEWDGFSVKFLHVQVAA